MRHLFIFIASVLTLTCFAQKVRVGYVNADSLLQLSPGYTATRDTFYSYERQCAANLNSMETERRRKTRELDSMRPKLSPLMVALREKQIEDMTANMAAYERFCGDETQRIHLRYSAYGAKIDGASSLACGKNKCTDVIYVHKVEGLRSPDTVYVNLNKEVAALLEPTQLLKQGPQKIGFINKDSLLRLIPEYRDSAAVTSKEITQLAQDMLVLDAVIEKKQKEIDSLDEDGARLSEMTRQNLDLSTMKMERDRLFNTRLEEIRERDSIRQSGVMVHYNRAVASVCSAHNLFYIYDKDEAKAAWDEPYSDIDPDPEATFFNMNVQMAEALGL